MQDGESFQNGPNNASDHSHEAQIVRHKLFQPVLSGVKVRLQPVATMGLLLSN